MPELRDNNAGRRKQFWAELQRIPSEEAYSCSLRQTIRADTRRSSCLWRRSHPWGPMFHCYSAYNSQTHCNLQERERKTQLWVVQVMDTKETRTQWVAGRSLSPLVVRVLPDVLSRFVSINCTKLIFPCNQTLKQATAAWNKMVEEKNSSEDGKIGSALRHSVLTSECILLTNSLSVFTWAFMIVRQDCLFFFFFIRF